MFKNGEISVITWCQQHVNSASLSHLPSGSPNATHIQRLKPNTECSNTNTQGLNLRKHVEPSTRDRQVTPNKIQVLSFFHLGEGQKKEDESHQEQNTKHIKTSHYSLKLTYPLKIGRKPQEGKACLPTVPWLSGRFLSFREGKIQKIHGTTSPMTWASAAWTATLSWSSPWEWPWSSPPCLNKGRITAWSEENSKKNAGFGHYPFHDVTQPHVKLRQLQMLQPLR